MPGPIPKRSDQRRRRNSPSTEVHAVSGVVVRVPAADDDWQLIARDWYLSLAESGQAEFYQPSDWQQARVAALVLSRIAAADKPSPELVKAWQSLAAELLTSEGSRRRLRLELERAKPVDVEADAAVAQMAQWRDRLGS